MRRTATAQPASGASADPGIGTDGPAAQAANPTEHPETGTDPKPTPAAPPAATSADPKPNAEPKDTLTREEHEAEVARRIQDYAKKRDADATARLATEAQQQATQQLIELAQSDPDHPLAQAVLAAHSKQTETTALTTALSGTYTQANEAVQEWIGGLPDQLRTAISEAIPDGKAYEGDWATGFKAYLGDVAKALKSWHTAETAAMRKTVLSELNGNDPSHDLTSGRPAPSGRLTRKEVEKMTPDEINSRWDDVQAALAA